MRSCVRLKDTPTAPGLVLWLSLILVATTTGRTWWIGSRTQWNVTKDFYMGVDVLYSKLQTADLNSQHGPGCQPCHSGQPT